MARIIDWRTWRRPGRAGRLRRGRGGGRGDWGEARTMIWTGALIGLAYFNVAAWTAPTPAAVEDPFSAAKAPDPWAESRKSGEILRGQEAAPARPQTPPSRRAGAAELASLRVVDGDTFW